MTTNFLSRHAAFGERTRQRMHETGRTPRGDLIWSAEEHGRLEQLRNEKLDSIVALFPGRTRGALRSRRMNYDLAPKSFQLWTTHEERVLRENAGKLNWQQISDMLPGRTRAAVQGRARYLGLCGRHLGQGPKKFDKPLFDAVRLRAWEDGIGFSDLDRELNTGGYFAKNGFRKRNKQKDYVNIRHIKKAVEFFGGELVIDWKDE